MQLTAKTRAEETKGKLKAMRRSGTIPAVLYSPGQEAQSITVERQEVDTLLRGLKSGRLSTSVLELNMGAAHKKVIIKDVQYSPTSYRILHLDFEELKKGQKVSVNVPILLTGVMDCVGVKLGGTLRQVARTVKVECLPEQIPSHFEINVKDLAIGKSLRLSDLKMGTGIRALIPAASVVVLVVKK